MQKLMTSFMKAITIKNIDCPALGFGIPAGVEFEIESIGADYSSCRGLGISLIWNDEYNMNINGIEMDTMESLTDERLQQLLLTADGKGLHVKEKALRLLLNREFRLAWSEAEQYFTSIN